MKKCLALILAGVMILLSFSFACAEETKGADLLELWDYGDESMTWVASAVPISEGIALASPSALPETPEHLAVSDGENTWEAKAMVPDDSGLITLVFFDPSQEGMRYDVWPLMPYGAGVPVSSCYVRYGDAMGSRINRAVTDAEDIVWKDRRCLLLTLTDPVPPGSPVLTADGQLAAVVVAEWAEGDNRVVALPPEEIAGSLTQVAGLLDNLPEWGDTPEGLNVKMDGNLVTIDWSDMTLPEKAEGQELYIVLMDTGNSYLSYFPAETENRNFSLLLTPGRFYIVGAAAAFSAPDTLPASYASFAVPQAETLTEYGFHPVLTAVAEAPESGLKEGEAPVPVTEVTEELLRSGRAYFYSHSVYEVTETIEGKTLLITLTDPNDTNYRYESGWIYSPDYMAEDIWFLSLKDMGLTENLDQNGYPAGVYRIAFYVDGKLADSFEFELK